MSGDLPRLDHENLDVYQCAIQFLRLALELLHRMPKGETELRDQLKRAAMSVPLNIAEGAGKTSLSDRARYHTIARGSAMESGALLDVCWAMGAFEEEELHRAKALLVRVVSMLTKMCR